VTLRLPGPLLLAGAGKMGTALLSGWLAKGLEPDSVVVQDPAPSRDAVTLLSRLGLHADARAKLSAEPAVVVLAVKPLVIDEVLPELAPLIGEGTVVLSIAAGKTLGSLARHLPAGTAIVRSMPNTPASIGQGITVACANAEVSADQAATCSVLLEAVGEVLWVEDESLLDAVTAVSGSGPAYVFLLAECLAEAGIEAGLDPDLAARLARVTLTGAGELLWQSKLTPAELRRNVTSPGGTTAAALEVLMGQDGLSALLKRAVKAAAKRSRDLSS
jgi:pyrroline-5-carboxylate reductase